MQRPPGYRFLQIVLIIGAIGFGVIGLFYLASGQTVPGIFALFLAVIEALALPLFKKLRESSHPTGGPDTDTK